MKTRKSITKRFKITKSGKVLRRPQDRIIIEPKKAAIGSGLCDAGLRCPSPKPKKLRNYY